LKVASFFHELGHALMPDDFASSVEYYTPDIEKEAWRVGFEEAKKEYGVDFSQKVHDWVEKQLQTYVDGWEREHKIIDENRKRQ
jgi:hypothetical protein